MMVQLRMHLICGVVSGTVSLNERAVAEMLNLAISWERGAVWLPGLCRHYRREGRAGFNLHPNFLFCSLFWCSYVHRFLVFPENPPPPTTFVPPHMR